MRRLLRATAKLAYENPNLRPALMPILRKYAEDPKTTDIYPHRMDHGWTEPLAGGSDIMRRVQNQFRHEQGLPTRPDSEIVPKVAANLPLINHLRRSYYEMSDGFHDFKMKANGVDVTKEDRVLQGLIKDLARRMSDLGRHLDRTYIWD